MAAPSDAEVRLHVYRAFVATERPPTVAETADALLADREAIGAAYRRLDEGHALVLEPGTEEVWMANPLSARPTDFVVRAEGHSYFGTCTWDGPGVLAMLGANGTVSTRCPDCHEPLELRIEGRELAPVEAVAHFAVPAARWWDDIGYT